MAVGYCDKKNHDECGEELKRCMCESEIVCGNFIHACPECDDQEFLPCLLCGAQRIHCSC